MPRHRWQRRSCQSSLRAIYLPHVCTRRMPTTPLAPRASSHPLPHTATQPVPTIQVAVTRLPLSQSPRLHHPPNSFLLRHIWRTHRSTRSRLHGQCTRGAAPPPWSLMLVPPSPPESGGDCSTWWRCADGHCQMQERRAVFLMWTMSKCCVPTIVVVCSKRAVVRGFM
jgi:hypothetical protein